MMITVKGHKYELRGGAWLDEANSCFYKVIGSIGSGYYLCQEIGSHEKFVLYLPNYNEYVPAIR